MRINYARKFSIFLFIEEQAFSFPFSLLRRYQMLASLCVKNGVFEIVQQFCYATEIGNVANALSL